MFEVLRSEFPKVFTYTLRFEGSGTALNKPGLYVAFKRLHGVSYATKPRRKYDECGFEQISEMVNDSMKFWKSTSECDSYCIGGVRRIIQIHGDKMPYVRVAEQ